MEECERGEIHFIGSSRFTIEFSVLSFFFTMIRSCCCRPLFRCGFPIPFDVISDFRSCFVDDRLRVFFIHIVLSRKIKQEAERFLFKNLISSRRSLTFHRFAFSRIGLSSFDFWSLLFRFLICKRYNLLSIAIWSISTSINWTRLIERCKFNIRKFMRGVNSAN